MQLPEQQLPFNYRTADLLLSRWRPIRRRYLRACVYPESSRLALWLLQKRGGEMSPACDPASVHYVSTTHAQLIKSISRSGCKTGQGVVFTQACCEHYLCMQLQNTHSNTQAWRCRLGREPLGCDRAWRRLNVDWFICLHFSPSGNTRRKRCEEPDHPSSWLLLSQCSGMMPWQGRPMQLPSTNSNVHLCESRNGSPPPPARQGSVHMWSPCPYCAFTLVYSVIVCHFELLFFLPFSLQIRGMKRAHSSSSCL